MTPSGSIFYWPTCGPISKNQRAPRTNPLPAGIAVLRVEGFKAAAAVRFPLLHDIALASERAPAFQAAEVLHVPVTPFCFGALVRQDDLRRDRAVSLTRRRFGAHLGNAQSARADARVDGGDAASTRRSARTLGHDGAGRRTSSQAAQRGLSLSAWCRPQ